VRTYVGQTRDRDLIKLLAEAGIGECTQRGELPPRRTPWFHDNGAWKDASAGRSFDSVRWTRDQWRIRDRHSAPGKRPDFVVCPDEVGAAEATFRRSTMERMHVAEGMPAYFVVQDGMTTTRVHDFLCYADVDLGYPFAGIFVGGGTEWKWRTLPLWRRLAVEQGIKLHVGRASTPELLRCARHEGADSADSSFPLWERDRLREFIDTAQELA
jgi:hypothetical protein